jgi:hypothetical protein
MPTATSQRVRSPQSPSFGIPWLCVDVIIVSRFTDSSQGGSVMFTGPMYEDLGNHWALTLFAFLSLIISIIPSVFYFWGPKIRSLSKYTPDT